MTEVSARSPAEVLVTKLRAIQVFADLPQDDLLWLSRNAANTMLSQARSLFAKVSRPTACSLCSKVKCAPAVNTAILTALFYRAQRRSYWSASFLALEIMTITGRAVLPTHYLMFPASNFRSSSTECRS